MKLYYAEWPNGTVTIVYAKDNLDLFWILDQEGDPYQAKVKVTKDTCAITTSKHGKGLAIHPDSECLWARVLMPGYDKIFGKRELQ